MSQQTGPFSNSYTEARGRLLDAATVRNLHVISFDHPSVTGPAGEPLTIDVVDMSRDDADRALFVVSGTHGIEGFAGSAIQLHHLDKLTGLANAGTSVILVHALNPHGFAHLRRVNERNIDLNRNFVDHASPPHRPDYDSVHTALVPKDWDGPDREAADKRLAQLVSDLGLPHVQAAITGGQWRHPDGLFYGGREPAWSNGIFRHVVATLVRRHRHVAYIDLHTGLGPRGQAEPIFRGGTDPEAFARAREWYGAALTRSEDGSSSSTPITGNTALAVAETLGAETQLTAITLEFGTRSGGFVLTALRADNWRHLHPDAAGTDPATANELMMEAFAPHDDTWRSDVLAQSEVYLDRAVNALRQS